MKYIFTFLLTIIYVSSSGQIELNNQIPGQINLRSPQTYEFMEYGKTPVAMFTGKVDINIPVYTYRDKDFVIPINLGYNSSGFIPNQREGIVGLNWFLNVGGAISRNVNGVPDDKQGFDDWSFFNLHGLYYGIKNQLSVKFKDQDCIFDFDAGCDAVSVHEAWNIGMCEVDPDEFSFNMMGFSGKFFIQNNGIVRCMGNKPYRVDLTDFAIQIAHPSSGNEVQDSKIKIITDDGYEYDFGGNIQHLEVSYSIEGIHPPVFSYAVIDSWYLTKIVAPNGREVTFTYLTFDPEMLPHGPADNHHYLLNIYKSEYAHLENVFTNCPWPMTGSCNYYSGSGGISKHDNEVTKTVYLEKISIDNTTTIEFNYSEKDKKFYQEEDTNPFNQKTLQLDNIEVLNNGVIVLGKIYSFGYEYFGDNLAKRQFLTSFIRQSDENPYIFDYYNPDDLPKPTTLGIDYWGYWNGLDYNVALIPDLEFSDNGDIEYTGTEREPSTTLFNKGLLNFVHYPTGGYTEYIYQAHDYSKRLERNNSNSFSPSFVEVSGNAGGARIHKIIDNDGTDDTNIREFVYKLDYPAQSTSSGLLLKWPILGFYWEYSSNGAVQRTFQQKSNSYNTNVYAGEKHIQYKEVVEKNVFDGSYTKYFFTNYESNPNVNNHDSLTINQSWFDNVTNINLYNSFVDRGYNDRSFERGYPSLVRKYTTKSGSPKIVYEKKTEYSEFDENTDKYVVGVYQTGCIAKSFKIYYYPFLMRKETEKVYSSSENNFVTNVTEYIYNEKTYLKEEKKSGSDETINKLTYQYPFDEFGAPENDYMAQETRNNMNLKNIIKFPLKTELSVDNVKVDGIINAFKEFDGKSGSMILPSINARFNKTAYVPESSIDLYDVMGNPIQYHMQNNFNVTNLWGYEHTLPIAKIENASYDLVETELTAMGHSIESLQSKSDPELRSIFDLLRGRPAMKDAMITSYTHEPLVGMTSQTDPTGWVTYYIYDSFGRLQYIRNQEGYYIDKYEYHYGEDEQTEKNDSK